MRWFVATLSVIALVDTDFGEQCDLGANNGLATTLCDASCFLVII